MRWRRPPDDRGHRRLGASQGDLVATVGRRGCQARAPNVIPGRVEFTIDLRSPRTPCAHRAQRELLALLRDIATRAASDRDAI